MVITPRLFTISSSEAVWFFSGGITIVLVGIINLLNRAYGLIAFELRLVCMVTNIFITVFSVFAGFIMDAGFLWFVVVVGLFGGVTLVSFNRNAII